jgi:hypothetical protein
MVTIHDLTWDDERLLELFWMLDRAGRGALMRHASVLACGAAQSMAGKNGQRVGQTAESVAHALLWKCRPPLPCGWVSDSDFKFEVEQAVCARLRDHAVDVVFTTTENDDANAAKLVSLATEEANRIGPDFCAPIFDETYVAVESMRRFIDDWRDAFLASLRKQRDARPVGHSTQEQTT